MSSQDQTIEDITQKIIKVILALDNESPRAGIIILSAKLDDQLKCLLEKRLIPIYKKDYDLFSFNSPLGTFSSRIDIAYSIGLINEESAKILDKVRKIRNDCAHQIFYVADESQSLESQINNFLISSILETDKINELSEIFVEDGLSQKIANLFSILTILISRIEAQIHMTNQIKV